MRSLEPIASARGVAARRSAPEVPVRISVRGKFLYAGSEKFFVRGVTYGTFATDERGREKLEPEVVDADFARMAANGFNAVRMYTVPPRWLLDAASRHDLRVMVGLPWEQHVAFLDDRHLPGRIERRMREDVRSCAGHPALLCYALGNEIPAAIVRWLGRRRVERFIERLYWAIKEEDPIALVTYVNYPSTEYLELPCLDFVSFNVYLEAQDRLEAYLARLHNLCSDRPLLLAEVGLDSRRHGEIEQARVLDWQLRTVFEAGCAGAFAFAWTDEWHRGGFEIDDWDFGLVRRDRTPKPALAAVREAFAHVPFRRASQWPRISVVVCAFNARRTIRECLEGLRRVDYPDFEVIVIDDGSSDGTGAIAAEYAVRLIGTENRGLSSARNSGLAAATGDIVAYLDSDAFPDRDWLWYLAAAFEDSEHAGVGGPNLAPPGGGRMAECFDNAPGGPVHVLLADREAEHIPGCNMAFRRADLIAIGGFDPGLRVAGDDVDVCWRLQERGKTLGFSPSMMVWHHRRTTLRSYWKQQRGYGRAEALLERKWPEKYNVLGHATWAGRIYAGLAAESLGFRAQRIYSGTWCAAPYQSLEKSAPSVLASILAMPEWYIVVAALGLLAALGAVWRPLLAAVPLFVIALSIPLVQAGRAAQRARFAAPALGSLDALRLRGFVALLYVTQPMARLWGRLENGLTFWRSSVGWPIVRGRLQRQFWSETWRSQQTWLEILEQALRANGIAAERGGAYDAWDLSVRRGLFGSARLLAGVEEHGAGKQLVRVRMWPVVSPAAFGAFGVFALLSLFAGLDGVWAACTILGVLALAVGFRTAQECAGALNEFDRALNSPAGVPPAPIHENGRSE